MKNSNTAVSEPYGEVVLRDKKGLYQQTKNKQLSASSLSRSFSSQSNKFESRDALTPLSDVSLRGLMVSYIKSSFQTSLGQISVLSEDDQRACRDPASCDRLISATSLTSGSYAEHGIDDGGFKDAGSFSKCSAETEAVVLQNMKGLHKQTKNKQLSASSLSRSVSSQSDEFESRDDTLTPLSDVSLRGLMVSYIKSSFQTSLGQISVLSEDDQRACRDPASCDRLISATSLTSGSYAEHGIDDGGFKDAGSFSKCSEETGGVDGFIIIYKEGAYGFLVVIAALSYKLLFSIK